MAWELEGGWVEGLAPFARDGSIRAGGQAKRFGEVEVGVFCVLEELGWYGEAEE
jgi:hypothetical protein